MFVFWGFRCGRKRPELTSHAIVTACLCRVHAHRRSRAPQGNEQGDRLSRQAWDSPEETSCAKDFFWDLPPCGGFGITSAAEAAMCGRSCNSGGRYFPGPPSVCADNGLNYCGSSRGRGGGGAVVAPGVVIGLGGSGRRRQSAAGTAAPRRCAGRTAPSRAAIARRGRPACNEPRPPGRGSCFFRSLDDRCPP